MPVRVLGIAAALWIAGTAVASAADKVTIGVLYPLSGPVAQVGKDAVAAVKTAMEIINTSVDLDMPLAKGEGLTGLGGAKIDITVGDHQGKPRCRPR